VPILYKGKYGEATSMIDEMEPATVGQIYGFLNHEAFTNYIAIMPDCHKGAGTVIGFTMPMTEKVIPNVVGVDIGCGMLSVNVGKRVFELISKRDIDHIIRTRIPFGYSVHTDTFFSVENNNRFHKELKEELRLFTMAYNRKFDVKYDLPEYDLMNLCYEIGMDYDRFCKSIGTLGGGNHFIEIGKSEETGDYWITFHSGSRQFGLKVALYHQRKAGRGELAYLQGREAFDYLVDMVIAQKYANENRKVMCDVVVKALNLEVRETIVSVHNYIDFNDFIIRKGAITSYEGQKMIIPWNMEDGITICEGKSNPEWNYSAPHGAGRLGSRSWAKSKFSSEVAQERMLKKGIFTSCVPVDEVKEAYKDPAIIEKYLEPTATIVDRLIPVLNLKSG
jgi:RNA-splicing ligase RtcB